MRRAVLQLLAVQGEYADITSPPVSDPAPQLDLPDSDSYVALESPMGEINSPKTDVALTQADHSAILTSEFTSTFTKNEEHQLEPSVVDPSGSSHIEAGEEEMFTDKALADRIPLMYIVDRDDPIREFGKYSIKTQNKTSPESFSDENTLKKQTHQQTFVDIDPPISVLNLSTPEPECVSTYELSSHVNDTVPDIISELSWDTGINHLTQCNTPEQSLVVDPPFLESILEGPLLKSDEPIIDQTVRDVTVDIDLLTPPELPLNTEQLAQRVSLLEHNLCFNYTPDSSKPEPQLATRSQSTDITLLQRPDNTPSLTEDTSLPEPQLAVSTGSASICCLTPLTPTHTLRELCMI